MINSNLGKEFLAIVRLAAPLVAAQLSHVMMVFTDTLMMGLLGPAELAGGGLGAACYAFVSTFCVGVIAAVGNLVAIRQGAGDRAGLVQLTQNGLWLGLALALLAGLLLWNLPPILALAGQQAENISAAKAFLTTLVFALPGYMIFMVLRGFSAAIGQPGPVMGISIGAALVNFVLNWALLHGWFGLPQLGLAGIGLATALVSSGMALLLAWHLLRHANFSAYRLTQGLLQPRWHALKELLCLGLPIGGSYALESGLFALSTLCMGALGSNQLAAHQIAIQSVYVAFMVPVGISYATTFRIGQHFGAGQLQQARQAGRLGLLLGAACMLCFALLFWLAPYWVVGLFIDLGDARFAELAALAANLLAIAACFEFFDGIQTIAMAAIRGLKDGRTSLIVGLICYWLIGAPLIWLLSFQLAWGAYGVWWGLAGALACAAIGLSLCFECKILRLMARSPSSSP